jgi:hypothetical protein
LKIAIPVAQFHRGNTAEYILRSCCELGHETKIIEREEFQTAFSSADYDFYFCVDSGEPLNFLEEPFHSSDLSSVSMWFIDYRHHHDGTTRTPSDLENARALIERGGFVFQSQREDVEHCLANGVTDVSWLPLAADPEIWKPSDSKKRFDLGFAGNVWDQGRAGVLEKLLNQQSFSFGFPGHGRRWQEDAAKFLSQCRAGFNVNSWFGSAHAFDVNMRAFETLSCGLPLITNEVPSLKLLFGDVPFIRTYASTDSILDTIRVALADESFMTSGAQAREWVLQNATYTLRLIQALQSLKSSGRMLTR